MCRPTTPILPTHPRLKFIACSFQLVKVPERKTQLSALTLIYWSSDVLQTMGHFHQPMDPRERTFSLQLWSGSWGAKTQWRDISGKTKTGGWRKRRAQAHLHTAMSKGATWAMTQRRCLISPRPHVFKFHWLSCFWTLDPRKQQYLCGKNKVDGYLATIWMAFSLKKKVWFRPTPPIWPGWSRHLPPSCTFLVGRRWTDWPWLVVVNARINLLGSSK